SAPGQARRPHLERRSAGRHSDDAPAEPDAPPARSHIGLGLGHDDGADVLRRHHDHSGRRKAMKSFAQETHPRRLRLLLPLVAFAILLLVVAALGAGAAPAAAPKKPAASPHPAAPPAPPEPQHTTLDFQEENQDSAAPESDDASRSTSDYWIKRHAGNDDLVRFGENVTLPAGRTVMGDG